MTRIVLCAVIFVASVAWLGADQDPQLLPRDLSFFAGKWELAVGQHLTLFDRILELKVDGTKLTGTITAGTRTVKFSGQVKSGIVTFRTETPTDPAAEAESFTGGFSDGRLQGCYFRRYNGSWSMTGWAATRAVATSNAGSTSRKPIRQAAEQSPASASTATENPPSSLPTFAHAA